MNAHQVITGALNNGENVYALGNIEGLTFTACAVGSDVVILDSDFNRVQIIPESKNHLLVSSLSCCQETGKIAVTYGNLVKILEATNSGADKSTLKSSIFQFTWVETYSFTHKEPISSVQWSMEGLRLLFVIGNKLVLHQHRSVSSTSRSSTSTPVTFCISDDDLQERHTWEIIWTTSLPYKPKYIRYSPDGYYLALSGDRDCFIKIFYQNGTEHTEPEFIAITLNHPAPVCGFEWRKTGRYMPRKCISPILMSWCEDRTSRIWKETPAPETSIIDLTGEGGGDPLWDRQKQKKFLGKYIRVKKTKTKILNKLRKMMPEKHQETDSNPIGIRAQIGKSPSLLDIPTSKDNTDHQETSFYLAATINAETDCLLVPSFNDHNNQKPFSVHWLNNKELVFSVGAEKLLAEAVLLDLDAVTHSNDEPEDSSPTESEKKRDFEHENVRSEHSDATRTGGSVSSDAPSSKDILDVKLEILLRQWTKSNDVLFSIHPVDGSLLTWTVEWLDDHFRQPVISYSSRLPGALPSSDSMSLHSKLNTFNPHEPIYLDALRNDMENKDTSVLFHDKLLERRVSNTIHVLTSHDNGTLNLWHMSVDDQSSFSHVVSMTHISRMCGHRFQMQQIIAHPVLPLLLTTSKFKSTKLKVDSTMDVLSEVILWKITPVGPLCKNGGVKELARVASPSINGFSTVGWVPAILPSCTLGTVCNSPSSCFISCDGNQMIIYQAVLDARGLLSELSNAQTAFNSRTPVDNYSDKILRTPSPRSDRAPSFLKQFNVVSTQSTAKPGCVLEVGKIEDVNLNDLNLMFLHVFQSRIVMADDDDSSESNPMSSVIDRSRSPTFRDKFFIVIVDQKENEDVIMMFSLTISSQPPQSIPTFDTEALPGEKGFLRPSSPLAPSMAKLNFEAELVCRQVMPLPEGTRITNMAPAAGHLSSSSLYPACETPYVLVSSDNDDSVRFWRCAKATDPVSPNKFEWREWNMISDNHPSELGVEGSIVKVNAAHSGRIACAYQKPNTTTDNNIIIEVAVFECESSGGVEWFREDSFRIQQNHFFEFSKPHFTGSQSKRHSGDQEHLHLLQQRINAGKPTKPSYELIRAMENASSSVTDIAQMKLENMVRLDWVSTEDGTHMLTVGMGTKVYIYAQIGQDPAQQNVTLMRESETSMRRPSIRKASSLLPNIQPDSRFTSWVCCRVLNLDTADGLPPIPTALSWVRDGILIVGMQSEMRVYNQWNFKTVQEKTKSSNPAANPNIVSLTVSTSHSMLDQLTRKKEALVSSRSRVFLEFVSTMNKAHPKENESQMVLNILKSEGVFETARMCSPILPQYHPKQLIVLLNAGKKRRVKAILNHVLSSLKQKKGAAHNPLSRAASIKRMSTVDREDSTNATPADARIDDDSMDYDEIDDIPLLPLYALMKVDFDSDVVVEKSEELMAKNTDEYDDLFDDGLDKDGDIDAILRDNESMYSGRSRHMSGGSDMGRNENQVSAIFTAKDYRKLTELLTHTHLPGLSSVDQMHLLAIADTLSHFASDAKDKVEQANAAMKPVVQSVLGDNTAGGYATAAAGVETVDECGLRYLMAMKQHEYLMVCLPMKQRMELKKSGLSASNIIWAQHSETETELLNAVPGMHRTNPSWEELKGLGVAWWLKNTASLKICIEKIAKAAFQQNQDPMDASLFYLALRKKNVLTHLFKTIRNTTMADFFMNDFTKEHWQKVAAKNAFVLMSKQRFQHAAAFFLLSGSLKDAVQTLCSKCNDVQLALVVVRMYESDPEAQQAMINEVLCREVLGITYEEFETQRGCCDDDAPVSAHASKEPFERSMAFWILKDYTRAAHTLVQEAQSDRLLSSLSDIFNFYSYLRKHPLVVRQRLNNVGAQVGTTEKLLALGRQLESILTPPERRLFFRTSAEHMARGCPMLSLDVLNTLPKRISIVQDYDEALKLLFGDNQNQAAPPPPPQMSIDVDWSKPTTSDEPDELKLDWSDEEKDDEEIEEVTNENTVDAPVIQNGAGIENAATLQSQLVGATDIFAQHMKFVASLRILTEELSTLASGFDVDGGQLRNQLLNWLEREVEVLQTTCDYNVERKSDEANEDNHDSDYWSSTGPNYDQPSDLSKLSRASPSLTPKRITWLKANQKLLRSFTSFCTLHSAHNHRLASVLMELLLLLLNVQRDGDDDIVSKQLMATGVNTFPLLDAAVSTPKMFVSSPLAYIENQGSDLLAAISELSDVPNMAGDLQKCYMLYNLCQGFSCCIYLSLTDIDQIYSSMLNLAPKPAPIGGSENHVVTPPVKWPGVEALVALLGREKEDDAPQLRLLIIESFLAISMSLFCFALSAYDSRWLFRLSAHEIDPSKFGLIFGGGGESKKASHPPARPPRPAAPVVQKESTSENNGDNLRSRLNLRILGNEKLSTASKDSLPSEALHSKWVPPQKNIVQLFAEKPSVMMHEDDDDAYESDEEDKGNSYSDDEEDEDTLSCENAAPASFAWQLLRLALIQQQLHRVKQFLILVGFDPRDIPTVAPRIDSILQQLNSWISLQHQTLKNFPGGIPNDVLPDMTIDMSDQHLAASMKKYAVLVKKNNTPFESEDRKIQSIQRLWTFLVREDHLQEIFIKYIFSQHSMMESAPEPIDMIVGIDNNPHLPEAFKIVQKDSEPIVAFGCNQESPGLIVVSNGRELQEMDMSNVFKDQYDQTSWMWNRADLDMKNIHSKRDALRDNDDYQIFTDTNSQNVKHTNVLTPWIIDRSRRGLNKMIKRHIPGVRRIDSHPHAPFYVTGSSDGSIKVWKWGAKDTVYTARVAGQHAKVSKIAFSCNGNKFAAVDGDGMLCLWQASQATEQKKPFFSQRCHNKSATDVRFLGHSASVLLTAGSSSLDYNLGLWDTLLPTNRALVHSWVAHPEGATCALYVPNQQTIFSGGRHGEICLWDIRQRQLRHTIKAFDQMHVVKTLATDSAQDLIVSGSSEGDIKIWSADAIPQLMYSLPGEHTAKGGFSFRQVGQSTVQGVQQLFIDQNMRLFSCGADASLKFRTLPSIFNMTSLL
ncbi:RAVE complex protein Rav1 C-terminal domain-containing protein [Caenorhabditis elegans]|uniref:RAVE complex protein Rav1 C-terminal domain-containing protein n=1 Tax=Caenorhabditis elegans TaxID=6239 RepID=A0A4V0IL12_CAEEL|nr:RAVE complex protein Rav1 C-terminal domain-containing protein [Caenorhabditis elegans]VTW47598.1 RAVE complex protein Rav1 C-terminal domain-containing protein [Caenorhabditis elegans]